MKRCTLLTLFMVVLILACSPVIRLQPERTKAPICAAIVASEQCPVRVALGMLDNEPHAHAQAWFQGRWRWLSIQGSQVLMLNKDREFRAGQYVGLRYFLPVQAWHLYFSPPRE